MRNNSVANPYANIYLEEGVVYGIYREGVSIDLNAAKKIVEDRKIASDYSLVPMFVDVTNVKVLSKEARDYFGSEEGSELLSASAIYTNSRLSAFLANFLIRVNLHKTIIPVRLFTDRKKAIKWLQQYR